MGACGSSCHSHVYPSEDGRKVVRNTAPIRPPASPTFVETCHVFLPARVVEDLGLEPNLHDKGDARRTLWLGRVWELRALLAVRARCSAGRYRYVLPKPRRRQLDALLADPQHRVRLAVLSRALRGAADRGRLGLRVLGRFQASRADGVVLFVPGDGGHAWDNTRLCRMMCRMGYVCLAPDRFRYRRLTLQGRKRPKPPRPLLKAHDPAGYWDLSVVAQPGQAGAFAGAGLSCTTDVRGALLDPEGYAAARERSHQLRRAELHWLLAALPGPLRARGVFLFGSSDGAVAVARFDDQRWGRHVRGRVVNAFSMEPCYCMPGAARLGGHPRVPTLNIVGAEDELFGARQSAAATVAAALPGGGALKQRRGHGFHALLEANARAGLVAVLEGAGHTPVGAHDNAYRALLGFFLRRPEEAAQMHARWAVERPDLADLVRHVRTRSTWAGAVTLVEVPRARFPQHLPLERALALGAEGLQQAGGEEGEAALATIGAIERRQVDQLWRAVSGELGVVDIGPGATPQPRDSTDGAAGGAAPGGSTVVPSPAEQAVAQLQASVQMERDRRAMINIDVTPTP